MKNGNVSRALQKLDWIAKLSKETLSGGMPADEKGFRTLLNRIVLDVREACRELEKVEGAGESDKSDGLDFSDKKKPGLIPVHGGYRNLRSFQAAEIIYDGTVIFCDRFVDKHSRTHDQMVQAARSGRQNIAEGSMGSATSKKTELKLTNVAKASLEELLLDYEDFLRQHKLRQWDKNSPKAMEVRNRYKLDRSDQSDPYSLSSASPETAANTMICLINQACFLMRRHLQKLEESFLEEGGFTEKLYKARSAQRAS